MRVRGGKAPRKSKNRVYKEAKGFWGGRGRLWKTVMQVVRRSHQFAFKGRKMRKRDMRALWIVRINAALHQRGLNYSQFMGKLAKSGVALDRKSLAHVAYHDAAAFDKIVAQVTGK
jgi:large subunit ribosomal protein L20